MQKQIKKVASLLHDRGWLTALVLAVGIASVTGLIHTQTVLAANDKPMTVDYYCKTYKGYKTNTEINACKLGVNGSTDGTTCQDYADWDQAYGKICNDAVLDLAAGTVKPGTISVPATDATTTPVGSSSGSVGTSAETQQDINDTKGGLSDLIDKVHQLTPDAKTDANSSKESDNNPGYYINGAGKKQAIRVWPSGKSGGPAIVWFNGGGWHGDDGTAYCIAVGSPQKNCAPGTNGGGDTSAAGVYVGPPAGGGANARGYTVIEVSYRLGSSGVYYMFEDVMRGLKHVIENADKYHIDASKIAVGGDSAGGSLAMRVVGSGKSGAKAGIGWSAPTNGYTGIFRSYKSLLIGMDHSTCIPTDLAGLANTTDLLTGGNGDIAEYGQGISANSLDGLGLSLGGVSGNSPELEAKNLGLGTLTQLLIAAQYAAQSGKNVETISSEIQGGNLSALSSGVVNLSAKKLSECFDNFNTLSPALFASPDTPPTIMAGFDIDDVVGPAQATGMRDKLHKLGIRSESIIIPGDPGSGDAIFGATNNHLGYDPRFLCTTLNFITDAMQTNLAQVDCPTGQTSEAGDTPVSSNSSSSSSSSSSSEDNKTKACADYNGSLKDACTSGYDGESCSDIKNASEKAACTAGTKAGKTNSLKDAQKDCSSVSNVTSFTQCISSLTSASNGKSDSSSSASSPCTDMSDLSSILACASSTLLKPNQNTGSNSKDELTSACSSVNDLTSVLNCANTANTSDNASSTVKAACKDVSTLENVIKCANVANGSTGGSSGVSDCTGRSTDDILTCIENKSSGGGSSSNELFNIITQGLKLSSLTGGK